jgi:hypothetical protein
MGFLTGPAAVVDHVVTVPEARNRGIGTLLTGWASATAHRHGQRRRDRRRDVMTTLSGVTSQAVTTMSGRYGRSKPSRSRAPGGRRRGGPGRGGRRRRRPSAPPAPRAGADGSRALVCGALPQKGQQLFEVSTAGINYADTHHRLSVD